MKKLLFLISLYVPLFLQAQEFDLNKYKYRFQRYQSAQVNFSFIGNNTYNMYRSTFVDPNNKVPKSHYNTDKNNFNFSSNLPFNFTRTINTEKLQQVQSLNFNSYFSKSNEIRNKSKNVSASLQYSIDNRLYKDKNFYELNLSLNTYTGYNTDYVKIPYYNLDRRSNNTSGNFNISIGKGRGRLEFVSDAVSAMFLLQDLKKKAGIDNYTKEQIEAVAKGITRINTTRFIDYRYRLIDQLTLLDSTLKNNGILPTKAIQYFTTINDNWLYATRFQRMSGSRWSVNVEANGQSNYYHNRSKESDSSALQAYYLQFNTLYNGLSLNYAWSRQKGLKIQNSLTASLKSGYNFITQSYGRVSDNFSLYDPKYKPDNIQTQLSINYAYLYQPNTRTFVQVDLNLYGTHRYAMYGSRISNPSHLKNDYLQTELTPRLSIFKFFNPRFYYRLSASAPMVLTRQQNEGDYRLTTINTNYNFPISINMGFTYNFF